MLCRSDYVILAVILSILASLVFVLTVVLHGAMTFGTLRAQGDHLAIRRSIVCSASYVVSHRDAWMLVTNRELDIASLTPLERDNIELLREKYVSATDAAFRYAEKVADPKTELPWAYRILHSISLVPVSFPVLEPRCG